MDDKGHMRIQNEDTIEEWLRIWGKWILGHVGPDVPMCVSIEHNWRSPQCWDQPEPREPPLPDWIGFRVERAIASLPEPYRLAVRVEYSFVRQPLQSEQQFFEAKRRRARLPGHQYFSVVDKSVKMLELMLGISDHTRGASCALKNHKAA